MSASRIILGTANFLNPYGLYQKDVKLIQRELDKVISLSLKNKVTAVDTALHYGASADIVDLQKKLKEFKIINKIKPNENELEGVCWNLTDTLLLHIDPRQKNDTKFLIKLLSKFQNSLIKFLNLNFIF